jgi:hypothetical protein
LFAVVEVEGNIGSSNISTCTTETQSTSINMAVEHKDDTQPIASKLKGLQESDNGENVEIKKSYPLLIRSKSTNTWGYGMIHENLK